MAPDVRFFPFGIVTRKGRLDAFTQYQDISFSRDYFKLRCQIKGWNTGADGTNTSCAGELNRVASKLCHAIADTEISKQTVPPRTQLQRFLAIRVLTMLLRGAGSKSSDILKVYLVTKCTVNKNYIYITKRVVSPNTIHKYMIYIVTP